MKLNLSPRRSRAGLSLVGAAIIFGFIIVLGYLLLRILIKCMNNLPPPETNFPPPNDTNAVTSIPAYQLTETFVSLPSFAFDVQEVNAMTTPAGSLLIERSTNLIDWLPAWRIATMEEFNMLHDTNQAPQCFYRAVLIP